MNYAKAVALATRLINANGRSTTLQRLSSTPVDANKPWKGPAVPTVMQSVITVGLFAPPFNNESLGKEFIRDELLARCENVLLVATNAVDLTTFTSVLDSSVRWNIEWCQVLQPGATVLLYAFGIKR